jgi:hypothetical protein
MSTMLGGPHQPSAQGAAGGPRRGPFPSSLSRRRGGESSVNQHGFTRDGDDVGSAVPTDDTLAVRHVPHNGESAWPVFPRRWGSRLGNADDDRVIRARQRGRAPAV